MPTRYSICACKHVLFVDCCCTVTGMTTPHCSGVTCMLCSCFVWHSSFPVLCHLLFCFRAQIEQICMLKCAAVVWHFFPFSFVLYYYTSFSNVRVVWTGRNCLKADYGNKLWWFWHVLPILHSYIDRSWLFQVQQSVFAVAIRQWKLGIELRGRWICSIDFLCLSPCFFVGSEDSEVASQAQTMIASSVNTQPCEYVLYWYHTAMHVLKPLCNEWFSWPNRFYGSSQWLQLHAAANVAQPKAFA